MVPEGQICQSRRSMKEDVRRRGWSAGIDAAFKCSRKYYLGAILNVPFGLASKTHWVVITNGSGKIDG